MASCCSMFLRCPSILVASVFTMAFLWSTEATPLDCSLVGDTDIVGGTDVGVGTDTDGDVDYLSFVIPRSSVGDRGQCVPFHQCCDKIDSGNDEEPGFLGLIDTRTGNAVIDIGANGNNKCEGKLNLCCTNLCPGTKIIKDPKPPQAQCGKRNVNGFDVRVIGFEEGQTQQGEFPWMVVVMKKDETYVGGGSLIHPKVVLTAAHTLHEYSPEGRPVHLMTPANLMTRIGDWDISNQIESIAPQEIDVEDILLREKPFKHVTKSINVALIILKTEAVYGPTVGPVCLPEHRQNFNGKDCFVTGWGKDDLEMGEYQTIMKKVDVPIVDDSTCQTMLVEAFEKARPGSSSKFNLHGSSICAGGGREDACTGDGGSPLVCPIGTDPNELVQVGVVSWGIGCKVVGNPGVYGSIPDSVVWIKQKIAALG